LRSIFFIIGIAALFGSIGGSAGAQQASSIHLKPMTIDRGFAVSEGTATDISGMACVPEGAPRKCLVINDENNNAQFVTIQDDRMEVGETVPLIGDEEDGRTLGSPPKDICEGKPRFKNLDGEGVAYAAPYFYVVGSHGCGRKNGKFVLSSFILARVRVDAHGQLVDDAGRALARKDFAQAVETTYRVSDLLQRAGQAAKFFGRDLKSENGLNIEGVAVSGDRIWFGLRAPVHKGKKAYLVGAAIDDLFKPGNERSKAEPEVVPLELDGRGIRDLAALPDKRLLVIAGAPEGPEVTFRLLVVDPVKENVTPIAPLPAVKGRADGKTVTGKAEGVTVLDIAEDRAQIVVLFDGLANGAPHLATITIPPRSRSR
jgi:hypothetical protein